MRKDIAAGVGQGPEPIPDQFVAPSPVRQCRSGAFRVACFAAIPCLLLSWPLVRYGSARVGLAHLRGVPVTADPERLDLGAIAVGQSGRATVRIWNLTSGEIRIIGSRTECPCVKISDGIPGTIPPGRPGEVVVTVKPYPKFEGKYSKTLQIFTSMAARPARVQVEFEALP